MAMNFNRPAGAPTTAVAAKPETALMEVQPYDIIADQQATQKQLAHSPEIESLTAGIDVNDLNTIVTFGSHSAEEISKASDVVLRSMNMSQLDESSKMLNSLAKIMDQFDINEIRDNPSLFGKLFGNLRKQLDKILAKYNTMGNEVDKIYVEIVSSVGVGCFNGGEDGLRGYFEWHIVEGVGLCACGFGYFHELEKYIVAGDQGCQEIQNYMTQLQQQMEATGDQSITFELQSLQQALAMLEQRTQDLRTAESVALQSIPMIKTIQFSNMNLVRKINSAFIVTLPVFKQALAQAIMLKRQKIQADAISALDERTNEMLLKNARNTVEQAKITTRLASGSSIKADTLETTWRTIMTGLDETKKIQESARTQRAQDQAKLEAIKKDFMSRYNMPNR